MLKIKPIYEISSWMIGGMIWKENKLLVKTAQDSVNKQLVRCNACKQGGVTSWSYGRRFLILFLIKMEKQATF